jgi:hypothetical protein
MDFGTAMLIFSVFATIITAIILVNDKKKTPRPDA